MAACSEEKNPLHFGKLLPPITLSNTSISSLMTLVPVLVAMTSDSSTHPRFGDEDDRPPWWPHDIQWKNPKDYCYMGEIPLGRLLRKVIHSCYSYHGVEDLLCRLDDSPKAEDDTAVMSDIEIDGDGNNTTNCDNDGPVFVCCFCLDEFDSHKSVSAHQRLCQEKSQSSDCGTPQDDLEIYEGVHDPHIATFSPSNNQTSQSEFSGVDAPPHPVSLSVSLYHLPASNFTVEDQEDSTIEAAAVHSKPTTSTRKGAAKSCSDSTRRRPAPVTVSILKTRSQKKLDRIMDKHQKKKLMIQECRELIDVPKTGAWWVNRKPRRLPPSNWVHPNKNLTKQEFFSGIGLSVKKVNLEQSEESSCRKKEVDLDCVIVSVEGPLSMQLSSLVEDDRSSADNNATSPRASRSLMSQMSRDNSTRSARRRISSLCFVEDEWADREAINEGRDPRQMCLMTLDLSSPLGQRIRKFVKVDRPMNVVKDIELFCLAEVSDEKLRIRMGDFKVTYRRKCRATNWVHKYKFNKYQVEEFKTHMRTGLSSRSRYLKSIMGNCKVLLRRISERDIELYNMEKKVTIAQNIVVDDDLCITQIDIPEEGLKLLKNNPPPVSTSSATNHAHNPQRPLYDPFKQLSNHHKLQHQHQYKHSDACNLPSNRPSQPSSLSRGPHHKPFSVNPRSSNHCPSPPHVPNIFRNRSNSNTPSPPRHIPRDTQGTYKQALSALQQSTSNHLVHHKPHSHHHHQVPNHHQQHSNHRQHPNHHQPNPNHRQQHPNYHQHPKHQQRQDSGTVSPPSGFSSGVIISERRQLHQRPVVSNSNSRRKQPMNQVRHDDSFDAMSSTRPNKVSHIPSTSKEGAFINLADEPSSVGPHTTSSSSSHRSSLQGKQSSQNSGTNKTNSPAYSNSKDNSHPSSFGHFRIRDGKLMENYPMPSTYTHNEIRNSGKSVANHQNLPVSSYLSHQNDHNRKTSYNNYSNQQQQNSNISMEQQRQQQKFGRESHTSQGKRRADMLPHSVLKQQLSSNNTSYQLSEQPWEAENITSGHRQKHKLGPKSFQLARAATASNQHRAPTTQPSSFPKSNSTKMPPAPVDDDVMEVICIDD